MVTQSCSCQSHNKRFGETSIDLEKLDTSLNVRDFYKGYNLYGDPLYAYKLYVHPFAGKEFFIDADSTERPVTRRLGLEYDDHIIETSTPLAHFDGFDFYGLSMVSTFDDKPIIVVATRDDETEEVSRALTKKLNEKYGRFEYHEGSFPYCVWMSDGYKIELIFGKTGGAAKFATILCIVPKGQLTALDGCTFNCCDFMPYR